jgi:hypothetical protein
LRGCGRTEKATISELRGSGGTDRPALDASRRDTDKYHGRTLDRGFAKRDNKSLAQATPYGAILSGVEKPNSRFSDIVTFELYCCSDFHQRRTWIDQSLPDLNAVACDS